MKKIFSAFAGIFLATMLTFGAAAAGNYLSCTASSDTLKNGNTVTVKVSMINGNPFQSIGLSFKYDSEVFLPESGKWLISGTMLSDVDVTKNRAAAAFKDAVTKNGEIFELTLKVKDSAPDGNYNIEIEPIVKNGDSVISITGASVTVRVDGNSLSSEPGETVSSRPDGSSDVLTSSVPDSSTTSSQNVVSVEGSQPDGTGTTSDAVSEEISGSDSASNTINNNPDDVKAKQPGNVALWVLTAAVAVIVIGVTVFIIYKRKVK